MRSYSTLLLMCIVALMPIDRVLATDDYVSARFDNLSTNVGLNDNFDDGVIDPSIWSVEQARVGYGIWQLSRCDPATFIAASEVGGELQFAGYTCEYFDYSRVLVSKNAFSGPFTAQVTVTSLSGSGTQWGAGLAIVKGPAALRPVLPCRPPVPNLRRFPYRVPKD